MRLHGNAALSWRGRRRLAERVVVEGWTLAAAAAASGVSIRCAGKWVGRYRLEGERGLRDRSSRPKRIANRTPEERIRLIVAMRRLRFTGPEIAELLGMAASTVSGILTRSGLGRLGRLGLEQPLRYERSRPGELVHIDVKRLGRIEGGAGKRAFGSEHRLRLQLHLDRSRGQAPALGRLRVRARLRRRLQPPRLRGGAGGREDDDRDRLPRTSRLLLSTPRDPRRAALDRQWLRLRLGDPRARVPQARNPPQPHPALPAADERESRALHPHTPGRLGLRRDLSL